MDNLIKIELKEIFVKDSEEKFEHVDVKTIEGAILDMSDYNFSGDNFEYFFSIEDEHYEEALEETGVDFRQFDKNKIFAILAQGDFECLKESLQEAGYIEDKFSERMDSVLHGVKFSNSYIGDGKVFIKTKDYLHGRRHPVFEMKKGKITQCEKTIPREIVENFHELYFYADLRRIKNKDKDFKKSKFEIIEKYLSDLKEEIVEDMYINLDHIKDQEIDWYEDSLDENLYYQLDYCCWSYVLEKLKVQGLYEEKSLAA